jgi:DNA invertase Pin-like site-specific DNA recombinase
MPTTTTTTPKKCRLVSYYRVSTDKQGITGLGMEAQRNAVDAYAVTSGCTIVAAYTEVESGKRNDRPQLKLAVATARRQGARLVIAKLDRLGRNVLFIAGLLESGVDFVAADSPNDDKFMLHIKACFAEEEARKISLRTKEGMAVAIARGVVMGTPRNLDHAARVKGAASQRRAAVEAVADLAVEITTRRAAGESYRQIADALNNAGHTTRTGAAWSAMQIKRVADRT